MANLTFRAYLCLGGLKATHNGHFVSFNEGIAGCVCVNSQILRSSLPASSLVKEWEMQWSKVGVSLRGYFGFTPNETEQN